MLLILLHGLIFSSGFLIFNEVCDSVCFWGYSLNCYLWFQRIPQRLHPFLVQNDATSNLGLSACPIIELRVITGF